MTGVTEGMPDLRYAEYPGTISLDTVSTIRENLEKTTIDLIIKALTKPVVGREEEVAGAQESRDIVFTGALEEVNNFFFENRWTDGLAIMPPTIERVKEFLKYTDRSPNEAVAILRPGNIRVTPWNIAVNGVMAGCRPEYMPLLLAGVEAIGDPYYNLEQQGSTGGWNMFFVINGPIAKQLGFESTVGLVSRGPNTVFGRAMGLIRHNLAGLRPGEVYMGTFGYILPPVFAEHEELLYEMGWQPYHVDQRFDTNRCTVSAGGTANWGYQMYPATLEPERLAQVLAYDAVRSGCPWHSAQQIGTITMSERLVLTVFITPAVAKTFAESGWSKQDVKEAVWKNARFTLAEVDFEWSYGSHTGQRQTHKDLVESGILPEKYVEKGKLPAWFPKVVEGEDATIPVLSSPEQLAIFVCGDITRNKSMTFYTMYNPVPETNEVQLPANWDELMKELGYPPLARHISR